MAKISHGSNTWRSEGLAKKYKEQEKIALDKTVKHKKKKDTRKWCKGKVGVEHTLIRYFWTYGWESKRTNWIRSRCTTCGKEFHTKDSSIPLRIPVDEVDRAVHPVQVKVNGKAIPIDFNLYLDRVWCNACRMWEQK